jgi:hypothetical protein
MSNVSDLLKKKAEKRAVETEEVGVAVEVEGETPEMAAKVGEIVLLTWGNPQLVGGETIEIPLIVTLVDPKSGRLNGQMICDPTMQGMDPRTGRPIAMPPVVPVANVPYAATPRAMTWRHREG